MNKSSEESVIPVLKIIEKGRSGHLVSPQVLRPKRKEDVSNPELAASMDLAAAIEALRSGDVKKAEEDANKAYGEYHAAFALRRSTTGDSVPKSGDLLGLAAAKDTVLATWELDPEAHKDQIKKARDEVSDFLLLARELLGSEVDSGDVDPESPEYAQRLAALAVLEAQTYIAEGKPVEAFWTIAHTTQNLNGSTPGHVENILSEEATILAMMAEHEGTTPPRSIRCNGARVLALAA